MTSENKNNSRKIPINERPEGPDAMRENNEPEVESRDDSSKLAEPSEVVEEKSVEELLAEKEREAKENYDKYVRVVAEFENYKKRQERQKADFLKMSNEALIRDLLPILDSFDRALEHSQNSEVPKSYIEGIELARKSFMDVLEKNGLKPINAIGEEFDPHFHEAIMQQEDPDVDENTVISEVHQGFMLNDKLLRPSMVIVSKKPAQKE